MSAPGTGPQVGDRVEVTVTGTVVRRTGGGGPNLQIELDSDIVSAGDFCPTCGTPGVECEDLSHAWRDRVTTFEAPDRVVVLARRDAPLVSAPTVGVASGEREATAGELCTCGRQAVVVYTTRPDDPVGHCGLNNGGAPDRGWCPFCENQLRHDGDGWNESTQTWYPIPQQTRCPRYRLRLADPVQPQFEIGRDR